jgi:hypothetical protein
MPGNVSVYFVASPLQYLAARRIAERFEGGARQVLLWYKPAVGTVVRKHEWDAAEYLPWPRFEPLRGPFGRHRRLRANLRRVAQLAGACETLHLHSAVFDTEAINYFLRGLPRLCGARAMHARILPDGIISIRRYPLSPLKRALQYLRKLRRLFSPELDYWCFGGDRIGSDAPFCDRIYVLPGLPHQYPRDKAVELPPLAEPAAHGGQQGGQRRALVIGQPLAGFDLMREADMQAVSAEIRDWLERHGFAQVDYKGHPKDPRGELSQPGYRVIELDEALESYLSRTAYDAVLGVRSSALLFARQVYGPCTRVLAFGWDRVKFKSDAEREDMRKAFADCGVELV